MSDHLITLMILVPFFGAIAAVFIDHLLPPNPEKRGSVGGWIGAISCLLSALLGFVLVSGLNAGDSSLQAFENYSWIGAFSINYSVGVDGLSALMILLLSLVFPVTFFFEWGRKKKFSGIHSHLLILQSSTIGLVCAQDLFFDDLLLGDQYPSYLFSNGGLGRS